MMPLKSVLVYGTLTLKIDNSSSQQLYWYYCYLAGFSCGEFKNREHINTFWNLLSYSGDFLNPIPKDDTYLKFYPKDAHVNFPIARIWSFISRLLIAFFAYQGIQAFRKHGKK